MICILPVKDSSSRIENKNWREFHKGKNLLQIQIEKLLLSGIKNHDIVVATDNVDKAKSFTFNYNVEIIRRSDSSCADSTPMSEVLSGIFNQIGCEDAAWIHICCPLFDEFEDVFNKWEMRVANRVDSLIVLQENNHYYLDSSYNPIGWQMGAFHKPSQFIPSVYMIPYCCSILTKESVKATSYYVGLKPIYYKTNSFLIDIDTKQDFEMAQYLYARKHG